MTYSTLLFGGIGTLVETSQIQLDAFNQAFSNLGIDFTWSEKAYADSLTDAGGQNRLAKLEIGDGVFLSEEQIENVHAEKTRLYNDRIVADGLTLRPGVAELIQAARDNGIALGWVTTTSRDNIEAICRAVGDELSPALFDYIGDATRVDEPKPDSAIYEDALAALEADANAAIAVEDSPTGVAAAKSAGVHTVAFSGQMHTEHDFSRAEERVDSLANVAKHLTAG